MSEFLGDDLVTLSMRLPITVVNDLYDDAIDNDRRVATIVCELLKAYLTKVPIGSKSNNTESTGTHGKPKRKTKTAANKNKIPG